MRLSQAHSFSHKRRAGAGILLPGAFLLTALLCLPVATLFWVAFSASGDGFSHILGTVLPSAGTTTLIIMLGVGVFTATVGTLCAWLVVHFDFPLRRVLQWALMLPLAVPTYISAYAFVEFFSFTGPLQEAVRAIGGYTSARDYRFPEIRSLWGAILIFGLVLYPYVYLSVRALFLLQGSNLNDSARVLGATGMKLFFRITLPLVRPAIALGVTLALMETINDIGAVEYLGITTLTHSVFSVWLNQSDLVGATRIALFLLLLVFALIYLEHLARGNRSFATRQSRSDDGFGRVRLTGVSCYLATLATLLPVLAGFGIPIYVLGGFALSDIDALFSQTVLNALFSTVVLASLAAALAIAGGLMLGISLRLRPTGLNRALVRTASIGYAIPGTLVGLGVLIPFAAFDNSLDAFARQTFGISTGLLLTGSGAALVFAYVVRFMAMAQGNLENGLTKLSVNLDYAARSLGRNQYRAFREVLLPLMFPAIITAALLVFVDVVKELSATILLRPFGMDTLATQVYDYASQGRVEDGALACLLIILIGILPVILLINRGAK